MCVFVFEKFSFELNIINMECLKTLMLARTYQYRIFCRSPVCFLYSQSTGSSKYVQPMILATEKKRTSFSNILLNYGFSKGQVDHILNSPAGILGLNEKDLSANLVNWFSFEINDKFYTSLTANAELLTLAPTYVNNRFKELMTLFTKKDINKMLVTCPKVFLDDFVTVQEKVQYIVNNMQVEQKSVVKTYALQFDLYLIKCRHVFLCRSGHYKRVKKKEKSKNPPLDKVFSRNVEKFLKLSKLTEEEFLAFCDVYEHEEKDLQDEIRLQLGEEEEEDDEI